MDKKLLGIVTAVLGILLILISISFTLEHMARGLELHKVCTLDDAVCPFIEIPWQGIFSIGIGILFIAFGVLIYKKPFTAGEAKQDMDSAKEALKKLEGDERDVFQVVIDEGGMVFQSTLMDKTGYSKVKITRVLDKLENKRLIERKRRGMTNVVVLR